MTFTDFHCHVLPAMDDGAADVSQSAEMLTVLAAQSVTKVYATPHFYPDIETPQSFLNRRAESAERLRPALREGMPELCLGAEILVGKGLSVLDLTGLSFGDIPVMLFEFGGRAYKHWFFTEIDRICSVHAVNPMIAHIDRYPWLGRSALEELCGLDNVVFQINCEGLASKDVQRKAGFLLERGARLVLGTDSHNTLTRRPDFDMAQRYFSSPAPRHTLFSRRALPTPSDIQELVLSSQPLVGVRHAPPGILV